MAKKPTISNISSGYASTTTLNSNFTALRDGFDNTLSLDGSTPNSMGADFDVNGYRILNAGQIDTDALYVGGVAITSAADVDFQTTYLTASYTGDGSTVAYSLTANPQSEGNVSIYVDGVYQNKDTFSLSGTTVTFSEAPPLNAAIEIVYPTNTDTLNGSNATAITYNQGGTGAQDRTLTSRLQDRVSVNDFGASGDGVADDASAIQAAIDYGVSTGNPIYIPSGTYLISRPLVYTQTAPSGVNTLKLIGSGNEQANTCKIIKTSATTDGNGHNAIFVLDGDTNSSTVRGVSIEGLLLEGDDSGLTGSPVVNGIEIVGGGAYLEINDLTIKNVKYGVYSAVGDGAVYYSSLKRINVYQANTGIRLESRGTSTLFDTIYAHECAANGFRIIGYRYSTMLNCAADSNTGFSYNLQDCVMTMIGCGSEASSGYLFTDDGSYITNMGAQIEAMTTTSSEYVVECRDHSNVEFKGMYIRNESGDARAQTFRAITGSLISFEDVRRGGTTDPHTVAGDAPISSTDSTGRVQTAFWRAGNSDVADTTDGSGQITVSHGLGYEPDFVTITMRSAHFGYVVSKSSTNLVFEFRDLSTGSAATSTSVSYQYQAFVGAV